MRYYCRSSTDGLDTNLQLHALKRAACDWNDLVEQKIRKRSTSDIPQYKERLVFILNCLGLSLSQLLGQQAPECAKVPAPRKLLEIVIAKSLLDEKKRERLRTDFSEFLDYYDALRHFGKSKHSIIDRLSFSKLDRFRRLTVEIWDLVIAQYAKGEELSIEEEIEFRTDGTNARR